jgi:hypothetical protein
MNPKVFVSHASEDKERFVLGFATKLRAKGIDAWLDKWEILPGDSLIDKLFEEGIKNAQAVIVVVSNFSVNKPWVREELNAATVKRINGKSKLIPVVIDDCQAPEALQSTVWEKVKDLNNYDAELERIVSAIYEYREKPPLGSPPAYSQTIVDLIPGLTNVDSLVFKLACEDSIKNSHEFIGGVDGLFEKAKAVDIPAEEFYESLEILNSRAYIKGGKVHDGTNRIRHFRITSWGFEQYARAYVEDYDKVIESVGLQIVNLRQNRTIEIAAKLSQPLMLVNHIVGSFEGRGWVRVIKETGGDFNRHIYEVSPELKRILR